MCAVPFEQLATLLDIARISNRSIDLEVIAPAGKFDAVESPGAEIGGEIDERQIGPLAGEQGNGSGHLSSLQTGLVIEMLAQQGDEARSEPIALARGGSYRRIMFFAMNRRFAGRSARRRMR